MHVGDRFWKQEPSRLWCELQYGSILLWSFCESKKYLSSLLFLQGIQAWLSKEDMLTELTKCELYPQPHQRYRLSHLSIFHCHPSTHLLRFLTLKSSLPFYFSYIPPPIHSKWLRYIHESSIYFSPPSGLCSKLGHHPISLGLFQ